MAQVHPISRLGRWEGYEITEEWTEQRAGRSWCVIRLEPIRGHHRCCSRCGQLTAAIHDLEERRIRDLPLFEHWVELRVLRVRVECTTCGPKLERLAWLAPYARVTRRLAESAARLCKVMTLRLVAGYFGLDWKTVKEIDRAGLLAEAEARKGEPVRHQRTFNVARPTSTRITEMIQKRTITRGSGQPFSSK